MIQFEVDLDICLPSTGRAVGTRLLRVVSRSVATPALDLTDDDLDAWRSTMTDPVLRMERADDASQPTDYPARVAGWAISGDGTRWWFPAMESALWDTLVAAASALSQVQRLRDRLNTLAHQLEAGWDTEPDPDETYINYGQAFKEAARRIRVLEQYDNLIDLGESVKFDSEEELDAYLDAIPYRNTESE
jgi:hypothetical protein